MCSSDLSAPVIEQARKREDLAPLIPPVGCACTQRPDFFEDVPSGVDTYAAKQVMHSWDDAAAIWLLNKCRQPRPRPKLVVAEFARNEKTSRFVKNFDLVMSVTMTGNVRSEEQQPLTCRALVVTRAHQGWCCPTRRSASSKHGHRLTRGRR